MAGRSPAIGVSQFAVLTTAIPEGLQQLAGTGIEGVEVFIEGPQWWDSRALAEVERGLGLFSGPISVHPPSWDVNIASYTRPVRQMSIGVYRDAIAWSSRVGATYVVVHVGWRGDRSFPRVECLARAEDALHHLAADAAGAGVTLAVENVGWLGQEVCDQAEFTDLVHRLPAGAGALLDVGHALLAGWDVPRAARELAPRMVALHLHDNDGSYDAHLPMGEGRLAWDALLPVLATMPQGCQYIIEYAPGTSLDQIRRGADLVRELFPDG